MDINARIATRLRALRAASGLSLDALADRSKVSRSTISSIERAESSPTAVVLDRLAGALGVTLASLFEDAAPPAPSPVARSADQACWTDPESGYRRRNLSPAVPSPLQLVDVHFPPGKRVSYAEMPRDAETYQQIWVIEGAIDVTVGERRWHLDAGDCLAMRLDCAVSYLNPTDQPARYLVALSTYPIPAIRRSA
jgi:transcriptional regulator with XRE-family HTH domain